MKCNVCNEEFDPGLLAQVIEHEHTGQETSTTSRGRLVAKEFDSANISRIAYSEKDCAIDVTYTTGKKYRYFDVPESVFEEACESTSIGAFMNRNMKGFYRYAYIGN